MSAWKFLAAMGVIYILRGIAGFVLGRYAKRD